MWMHFPFIHTRKYANRHVYTRISISIHHGIRVEKKNFSIYPDIKALNLHIVYFM